MKDVLISFLSKFESLTNDEIQIIADNLDVRSIKKGTLLVQEGQISESCYFVLKGCLRQFVLVNGTEKTTQFYTEEQAAVLYSSYLNQVQSQSYLSCVEDSVLIVGELSAETRMYKEFPKLAEITRAMMAQNFGKSQDEFTRFTTSSPEERYQYLLKSSPELFQRVPLNQLASYIGITPESLSRIRKRLLKKN